MVVATVVRHSPAGDHSNGKNTRARYTRRIRRNVVVAALVPCLLYLAVTITYSLRTPAWENNDERDHALYVEYILAHHSLPLISPANGIQSHRLLCITSASLSGRSSPATRRLSRHTKSLKLRLLRRS